MDAQQNEVHGHEGDVQDKELGYQPPFSTLRCEVQELDGRPDVQPGYDYFLDTEHGDLYALHDGIAREEWSGDGIDIVGERDDSRRDKEDDRVYYDHGQDASEDHLVAKDEMETRP